MLLTNSTTLASRTFEFPSRKYRHHPPGRRHLLPLRPLTSATSAKGLIVWPLVHEDWADSLIWTAPCVAPSRVHTSVGDMGYAETSREQQKAQIRKRQRVPQLCAFCGGEHGPQRALIKIRIDQLMKRRNIINCLNTILQGARPICSVYVLR